MPFLVTCHDRPCSESNNIREVQLQAHFAYIETIMDRLLIAGPAGNLQGGEYGVSLFVYDVEDHDAAEQLLHNDPYFKAGLYGEVQINRFLPAAGRWIGGTVW